MRRQLRDLVKFIDPQEQQIVYTNFEDELGEIVETDVPTKQTGFSPYQYRKKVEAYIREHENRIIAAIAQYPVNRCRFSIQGKNAVQCQSY
jgi:type I restriction enzyme R subunit